MPVSVPLSAYKSHWVAGEPLGFDLTLQNKSRKIVRVPIFYPCRNWQPDYTVRGPGDAKPLHFNLGYPRLVPEPADRKFQYLDLVALKPGQVLEGRIEVPAGVADLRRPGDYIFTASVQTSVGVAEGGPLTLTVSAPTQPTQANLGFSGLGAWGEPIGCWIVSGPHGTQVQRNPFSSHRRIEPNGWIEDGTVNFAMDGGTFVATVHPDAREPFVTETNADLTEAIDWTGWRDGVALYAIQGFEDLKYPFLKDPILRFPLPGDARLVPHALMSADQSLDVFTLSADGRTLQMVRFLSPLEQYLSHKPQQEPRLAWSHPLSAPALTATAALAPAHAGSARHILWTSQQGDALLLGHVLAPASGQPPADAPPVNLPHAYALPGCRPAVRVDASGVTHVAVLYAADPSLRQISLAEVTYGADGRPSGAPVVLPQTTLPEAASSAVVSYGRDQYGAEERISFRRDWLVLLPDGRVLFSLGGRAAQGPVSLGSPLVLPLELASPAAGTFVLTLDPKTGAGPGLARLRE